MALIRITGITAEGRHGLLEEEDEPQPFLVDLELRVDPADDDLATTADYRVVVERVRQLVAGEHAALIETLAGRIAAAVSAIPGVRWCRAAVHKPRAAELLGVSDVAAEAEAGQGAAAGPGAAAE